MDVGSSPPSDGTGLACPVCTEAEPLHVLPIPESPAPHGLLHCPRCFGFWVTKALMALGIPGAEGSHPAFAVAVAPLRCKLCNAELNDAGACTKCGAAPVAIACPGCESPMERAKQGDVWLDLCPACGGTWFDTGELAEVFGLRAPRSLAMSAVVDSDQGGTVSAWHGLLEVVSRLVLFRG